MEESPVRKLYFAYGSNLNMDQMAFRCPGAQPVGRARLWDWELEFRRVLTIVRKPGACVEGALWWITPEDEEALDRYEGYPEWYDKRYVEVTGVDGEVPGRTTAMTYVLEYGVPEPPSERYLRTCIEGCRDFGIDPAVMLNALARSTGRDEHRGGSAAERSDFPR